MDTEEKKLSHLEILNLLKEKKARRAKRIEEESVVILERKQVNTNDPAIAQLWIKFPSSVPAPNDLITYHKERKEKYSIDAGVHTIKKVDDYTYVLEIRGVLPMYKWMEYFIKSFIRDYGVKYKIEVTGMWDKYESEV